MKKIISILLMISMAFSLVACSTEPASDVGDNDNSEVSGEVSNGVSNNDTDVTNFSTDELLDGGLNAFNVLTKSEWTSNDNISIDFNDDFTFTYTDSEGIFEGEWVIDRFDEEYDELWYDLIIRGEEFGATYMMGNDWITIWSAERDYEIDFNAKTLFEIPEKPSEDDSTLIDTLWNLIELEDSDGNVTKVEEPLLDFKFISATEVELIQEDKTDIVTINQDITSISLDSIYYYENDISGEFSLSGEFFEKYNNDGRDTAEVTFDDKDIIVKTDKQDFTFRYFGRQANGLKQDLSLTLVVMEDKEIIGQTGLTPFVLDGTNSNYTLTLKPDFSAEFSNGTETIFGTYDLQGWYIDAGIDNFHMAKGRISLSSDIFDNENYSNFYNNAINEAQKQNEDFVLKVDNSVNDYFLFTFDYFSGFELRTDIGDNYLEFAHLEADDNVLGEYFY